MGWVKFRRPALFTGGLKTGSSTGSASTDERVVFGSDIETFGTTGGTMTGAPITIITATDTGHFVLPTPEVGLQKLVSIDFVGATGDLLIVNPSTLIVFDGSTANIMTVSSSQEHLTIKLTGASATRWLVETSTGSGVTYSGSTVTG
jgi:hypothetical protein